MLYLIGLGLNEKGISVEGLEALKKCKAENIFLENYTVDFPYDIQKLEKVVGKKILLMDRGDVESQLLINKAKKKENVCLLVYGAPLFATTHMTLIDDAKKAKVKVGIIYSASVFDAIAETGLQLYKFGKISSMPKWQKNFEPDSFLDFVEENNKIDAHSLVLIDIGLPFSDALKQFEESLDRRKMKIDKMLICSALGTSKGKIHYGKLSGLKKKKVLVPYCFIIPGELHFLEKEVVGGFKK